ncbi:MAG: DEAD/DEAH box helicase [Nitrospirota bacterium]
MKTFSKFNLSPGIQRVLEEKKFLQPTPIQEKVIPQILDSSQDLIAIAQTGTGKTAAFSLPILTKMDTRDRNVQTVVLSPTRELAMQIAEDIKDFSKYMRDVHVVVVYGGSPVQNQIREIKRGAQIVVGTPGRMLDLLKRKVLRLENVQWAILDEADEMLNMGFLEDITSILSSMPHEKQTLLFSATMSQTIEKIARRYMQSPMRIEVKATATTQLAITHQFMMVPARDKVAAFQRYRELHPEMYGIVFCRTKRETQEIGDKLLRDGCPTGVLHGDIEQRHRTRIMDAFKRRETSLLVATDVAARGIDVEKLTHVIHVGVPEQVESYTHRSGRTGRANEKGISMVLAHLREHHALKRIEKMNGITFEEVQVPKREDMIQSDIEKYVKQIDAKTDASPLAKKYVDEMLQDVPKKDMEEVARKALLLAVEDRINKFPVDQMDQSRSKGVKKQQNRTGGSMKTLVISHGRKSNLTVPHLFGMINEVTRGERVDVGQIQIGEKEASFEVPSEYVGKLCSAMSERRFRGKSVNVQEGSEVKRTAESWKPKKRRKASRY